MGALLLTIILSFSGAYDTDEYSFSHRSILWLIVSILLIFQTVSINTLVKNMNSILAPLLVILSVIILMTVELHGLKFTPLLPKAPDPIIEFALFTSPLVGSIASFILLLNSSLARRLFDAEYFENQIEELIDVNIQPVLSEFISPSANDKLFDNWPNEEILCINAQDHYLELKTKNGSTLLRGRMRDAIANLNNEDGVQVHRSWWIARKEIREVIKNGRDYTVVLLDGTIIPIGRSRVKHLKEQNIL